MDEPTDTSIHSALTADDIQTNVNLKVYPTFESMQLKKEILQGIYSYGK